MISLTPLIDVVFILLIFFMLASSFLDWRSISLMAPAMASSGSSTESSIVVRIYTSGSIDLNGSWLTIPMLEQRITSLLDNHPDQHILIQPENGVPLQQSISLLDQLNEWGVQDIRFMRRH